MRLVLLGLLLVLMVVFQALHTSLPENVGPRAALAFGFLLLFGFTLGEIVSRWTVPRITGYLLAGMTCGPYLVGLVDLAVVDHLELVNELALCLIAFTAGGELKINRLKARLRTIGIITIVQTLFVFLAMSLILVALRPWLFLFQTLESDKYIAIIIILSLIATAKSPSTAVAVIVEARSQGPITDIVLGTTVLKDIVVLICFSLVMSFTLPVFGAQTDATIPTIGGEFIKVVISLPVGIIFGLFMSLYFRFVGKQNMLFILASAFILISLSAALYLDSLLVATATGFTASNFSRQGNSFLFSLEQASTPVFLIFFCLAGASPNLSVLISVWHVALLYVLFRILFIYLGTAAGAKLAAESKKVRNLSWTGFIGQAGVSLGLVTLAKQKLPPEIGSYIFDLVVGIIIINQILGPILFRWALLRTGEGKRT